jgi:hypothetical protein
MNAFYEVICSECEQLKDEIELASRDYMKAEETANLGDCPPHEIESRIRRIEDAKKSRSEAVRRYVEHRMTHSTTANG